MNDDERELAINCYGYGRWKAPYWFIGPEQAKGKLGDKEIVERARAYRKLNQDGLCDCREFHIEIGQTQFHFINEKEPRKKTPPLQPTWKSLILLLMAFQEKDTKDVEVRRDYQRNCWGSSNGETCVIELSGLPARNLKESSERDHRQSESEKGEIDTIRQRRIEYIHQQMLHHEPEFVVIYGKNQWGYWKKVADDLEKKGRTKIEYANHPTDYFEKGHKKNHYYISLGKRLR